MGSSQSDQKPEADNSSDSRTCACGTKLTDSSTSSCSSCTAQLEQKQQQQTQQSDDNESCYVYTDSDFGFTSSSTNLSPCTNSWVCDECVTWGSDDSPSKDLC